MSRKNMKERQCPHCGTMNDGKAVTCQKCGTILHLEQTERRDYKAIGILVVLIVAVLGTVLFIILSARSVRQDKAQQQSEANAMEVSSGTYMAEDEADYTDSLIDDSYANDMENENDISDEEDDEIDEGDPEYLESDVWEQDTSEDDAYGDSSYDASYDDGVDYGLFVDGRKLGEGDYIISDSDERYLTEDDISMLTSKGINYAKNEIFARYGRKFNGGELDAFFSSRTWYEGIYEPTTENDEKIASFFNDYELYNVKLLHSYE